MDRQRQAIVERYLPVAAKVAAYYFRKCEGRLSLAELRQQAELGLCEAMRKWDPAKASFAPYARRWAIELCKDLLRRQAADDRLLPIDPERDDEPVPEFELCARDASRVREVLAQLPRRSREIAAALGRGLDDDEACEAARCTLAQLDRVRAKLRRHLVDLGEQAPAPISAQEAADRLGMPRKALQLLLQRGHIPLARKRGGRWYLPLSALRSIGPASPRALRWQQQLLPLPKPVQPSAAPQRDLSAFWARRKATALRNRAWREAHPQLPLRWFQLVPLRMVA